jgi:multidrug resistance protein MdtO
LSRKWLRTRSPIEHKPGFFAADAFRNPDHVRFAAKGATAVTVCYLTFTLLDWPGIHTAMLTCFIVGLTTIGETLQKLTLRIVGCCAGAALGILSIVYILPHTTSISSLLLLIGLVTLPAAWIAVGRPTVSYIGFQFGNINRRRKASSSSSGFDFSFSATRCAGRAVH